MLNSFVDHQLEADDKNEISIAAEENEGLRNRICELREIKGLVQNAYQQVPSSSRTQERAKINKPFRITQGYLPKFAFSLLLLAIGWSTGWLSSGATGPTINTRLLSLFNTIQAIGTKADPTKIVVLVTSSNPVRTKSALDVVDRLYTSYGKANKPLNVEVIANSEGLNLLRTDKSPYVKRLESMLAKHPQLRFMACNQTIKKLQKKGISVKLLPNTRIVPSAAQEIEKRLNEGWDYIRS